MSRERRSIPIGRRAPSLDEVEAHRCVGETHEHARERFIRGLPTAHAYTPLPDPDEIVEPPPLTPPRPVAKAEPRPAFDLALRRNEVLPDEVDEDPDDDEGDEYEEDDEHQERSQRDAEQHRMLRELRPHEDPVPGELIHVFAAPGSHLGFSDNRSVCGAVVASEAAILSRAAVYVAGHPRCCSGCAKPKGVAHGRLYAASIPPTSAKQLPETDAGSIAHPPLVRGRRRR